MQTPKQNQQSNWSMARNNAHFLPDKSGNPWELRGYSGQDFRSPRPSEERILAEQHNALLRQRIKALEAKLGLNQPSEHDTVKKALADTKQRIAALNGLASGAKMRSDQVRIPTSNGDPSNAELRERVRIARSRIAWLCPQETALNSSRLQGMGEHKQPLPESVNGLSASEVDRLNQEQLEQGHANMMAYINAGLPENWESLPEIR